MKHILSTLLITLPLCFSLKSKVMIESEGSNLKAWIDEAGALLYTMSDEEIQTRLCDSISFEGIDDDGDSQLSIQEAIDHFEAISEALSLSNELTKRDIKHLFFLIDGIDGEAEPDRKLTTNEVCAALYAIRDHYSPQAIEDLLKQISRALRKLDMEDVLCALLFEALYEEYPEGLDGTAAYGLLSDFVNMFGIDISGLSQTELLYLFDLIESDEDEDNLISIDELCHAVEHLLRKAHKHKYESDEEEE